MALNPFKQLEFFVPEPKRAFGEIVELILRGGFAAGVRRVGQAEGRLEVVEPPSASRGQVTLYQAKYFVGRWESAQRRELREAFQGAFRKGRPPRRWVLCLPDRMVAQDLRWFEHWRRQQPVGTIEALEGPELLKMLKAPSGRAARERIQSWGVTVSGEEFARVQGRLKVRAADPPSGLTHYLHVSLYHGGGRVANGLKVELAHSLTRCLRLGHDERDWADEGEGDLNPRRLRACRPLRPGEQRLVAVIPLGPQTPWPVGLRVGVSVPGLTRVEQHLCLEQKALGPETRLDFAAGPGPELALVEAENLSAAAA